MMKLPYCSLPLNLAFTEPTNSLLLLFVQKNPFYLTVVLCNCMYSSRFLINLINMHKFLRLAIAMARVVRV
jgi:hypothetical protein